MSRNLSTGWYVGLLSVLLCSWPPSLLVTAAPGEPLPYTVREDTVAMLLTLEGSVQVKRATAAPWQPATPPLPLYEGDSLKTGPDSRALLVYPANLAQVALGPQETMGLHAFPDAPGPETGVSLSNAIASLFKGLLSMFEQAQVAKPGIRRGWGERTLLIYPRYGKLLTRHPAVAWLPATTAHTTWVSLVQDDHASRCGIAGRPLWQHTSSDTTLRYPAGEPPLREGQRYWIAIGRSDSPTPDDTGCFTVATAEERRMLAEARTAIFATYGTDDSERATACLLYAGLLMQHQFFADAHRVLEIARARQPANATIRAALAHLYQMVGPSVLVDPTRP